ncbi:MAG: hypothetical protein QOJ66_3158 [Ilumatobacteraceae bacterium]
MLPYPVLLLAVVGASIASIGLLASAAGVRSRDPAVVLILILTTYWTIVGAIPVILAKWQSPTDLYSYLETRLFRLRLDNAYGETLLMYSFFLVVVGLLVVTLTRRMDQPSEARYQERWTKLAYRFSHSLLLIVVFIILLLKLAIVLTLLRSSADSSIYIVTRIARGDLAPLIRIYQYLNIASSYSLSGGLALWLSFSEARLSYARVYRRVVSLAYLGIALLILAENAILGNRSVPLVMMGAVTAGWTRWRYLPAEAMVRRRLRHQFVAVGFTGFVLLGAIGISRGGSLSTPTDVAASLVGNVSRVGNLVVQEVRSSEKVAAHMSLYGIVERGSFVPDPAIRNSYGEYARIVNAPSDQVFTIHYVTSWWLRLGLAGVLVATLTFALVVVGLQRLASGSASLRSAGVRLAAATLPAAALPITLIRGGPESLRAVAVEILFIPAAIITPCFVIGRHRPGPAES